MNRQPPLRPCPTCKGRGFFRNLTRRAGEIFSDAELEELAGTPELIHCFSYNLIVDSLLAQRAEIDALRETAERQRHGLERIAYVLGEHKRTDEEQELMATAYGETSPVLDNRPLWQEER